MQKYQGVKEFHLLAHISCYYKMMVFSPFKLEISPKGNKLNQGQRCPFQPLKPLNYTVKFIVYYYPLNHCQPRALYTPLPSHSMFPMHSSMHLSHSIIAPSMLPALIPNYSNIPSVPFLYPSEPSLWHLYTPLVPPLYSSMSCPHPIHVPQCPKSFLHPNSAPLLPYVPFHANLYPFQPLHVFMCPFTLCAHPSVPPLCPPCQSPPLYANLLPFWIPYISPLHPSHVPYTLPC